MNDKLVSVIIPVYNADEHLHESISSIVNQDYPLKEIIVVNDGSNDNGFSKSIIKEFDKDIIYYEKKNSGLADTLNFAIEKCNGEYIARMDADDISEKNRLSEQVSFMEKNLDVTVCGSFFDYIIDDVIVKGEEIPINNEDIELQMLFKNVMCHPSVMFRASDIKGKWKYDTTVPAEDYELWTRMIGKVKFANIPKVLLHYRINKKSITHTKSNEIAQHDVLLHKKMLQDVWGLNPESYSDEVLNFVLFSKESSFLEKKYFIINVYEYLHDICTTKKYNILKKKYSGIEYSLNSFFKYAINITGLGYANIKKLMGDKFDSLEKFSRKKFISVIDHLKALSEVIFNSSSKVVLCGAGLRCRHFLEKTISSNCNFNVVGILDNNKSFLNIDGKNLSVVPLKNVSDMLYDYVLITSNKFFGELQNDLLSCGVQKEKIYSTDILNYR